MTFQEHLSYLDDLRKFSDISRGNVSYKHVQQFNGKAKRSRVATLILYPLYDDSHYYAEKRLEDLHIPYCGITHDNDFLDPVIDPVVDQSSAGDTSDQDQEGLRALETSALPDLIIEDQLNFDPENIVSPFDSSLKKIHDHIVIKTADAHTNTAIAKWLHINSVYVRMWDDKMLDNRIRYQTHKDDFDKVQYSPDKLFGCLSVRYAQIAREYCKKPSELLRDILVQIQRTEKTKYIHSTNFFIRMINEGYDSCLRSFRPIIRDAIIEHNMYANFLKQEGIREFDLDDHRDLDYNPDSYIGRLDINK